MNETASVTEKDLISWVEKSLENEKLRNFQVNFTGSTEKGDGYIGEIVFVAVNGTTAEGKEKNFNLVLKYGKRNEHVRKTLPLRAAFHTEMHMYNTVFPALKHFQIEKNIVEIFQSVPRCYKTFISDHMEALVLDDLKIHGYHLHNRKETFNIYHLKSVLTEYGKLHALSFAFRDQRLEEFNILTSFDNDAFKGLLDSELFKRSFEKSITNALNMLQEKNELDLMKKFKNLVNKNAADMILDLCNQNEPQSVIEHGDCWNNNFMFKYRNVDKVAPIEVAILDWQLSALRSPVFDLSFLIYSTSSKNELDQFDQLMNVYYDSFSNFLVQLGSDPEELFPYIALKAHWSRYSSFGLLLMTIVLPMVLCDKNQAPAFENLQEDETFGDMLTLSYREKDICYSRLTAVIHHYFENSF